MKPIFKRRPFEEESVVDFQTTPIPIDNDDHDHDVVMNEGVAAFDAFSIDNVVSFREIVNWQRSVSFELQFIERSTKKREKITIERKSYVSRQSDDAIRAEENGEQEQQASVDLHPYSTVDDINL